VEAPPQFPGAPKKSKTGLILGGIALALIVCCCGICGVGGYFGKGVFQKAIGMAGCSVGIEQQRDALLAYAAKNGGKLPPAATWQDAIKPYVTEGKKQKEVPVPTVSDDFCDKDSKTSITYNAAIAGKSLASVSDQMGTVALFETPGLGRNQSAPWKEPSFASSPKMVADEGRGWIRVSLKGVVSMKDKTGNTKPVPTGGKNGGFEVETESSSSPIEVKTKVSSGDGE
jgi:hypothetical protein